MSDERRIDDRLPVIWKAVLIDDEDQHYPALVRDISLAGALVTTDAQFIMDTDLLLEIEGLGSFAGRVKWHGRQELGLLLLAGDDLALKKFAEKAGAGLSLQPAPEDE